MKAKVYIIIYNGETKDMNSPGPVQVVARPSSLSIH
jgi:hypothetical protein